MSDQSIADILKDDTFNKYINIKFIQDSELPTKALCIDGVTLTFFAMNMLAKNKS